MCINGCLLFSSYDYLLFRDGLSNQVDSKICGFLEYPHLVTIKGNIAVVVFKSDSAVNKKGFLIKYEAYVSITFLCPDSN